MKGGNEASAASGITQFANGEPKRWNYDTAFVRRGKYRNV